MVVVDVQHVQVPPVQEVDGSAVDVAAVEEHDRAVAHVVGQLVPHTVEAHALVLVGQRELVRGEEHHGVLAELLEHEVHAEQRSERVAVRVLVGREKELLGPAQLFDQCVALGQEAHLVASSISRVRRAARSVVSS